MVNNLTEHVERSGGKPGESAIKQARWGGRKRRVREVYGVPSPRASDVGSSKPEQRVGAPLSVAGGWSGIQIGGESCPISRSASHRLTRHSSFLAALETDKATRCARAATCVRGRASVWGSGLVQTRAVQCIWKSTRKLRGPTASLRNAT
jgi:hypothetical protein